jgi:crossover junction endodeoxyribonuclease RuvC
MIGILGIDPGLAFTGWGLVNKEGNALKYIASGVIKTDSAQPIEFRLNLVFNQLQHILTEYKPACVAIEETFVNMNSQSSLKLAHVRGAIMVAIAQQGLAVNQYAPNLIKKSLVGYGRAEKSQMIHMVNLLLPGCGVKIPDEADALGVAICHSGHTSYK